MKESSNIYVINFISYFSRDRITIKEKPTTKLEIVVESYP